MQRSTHYKNRVHEISDYNNRSLGAGGVFKTASLSIFMKLLDETSNVKQHLDAETNVDAKNKGDDTPLHIATREGDKEIVELLIAKGADVNSLNKA